MTKVASDNHRAKATPAAGLPSILLLLALFVGGTYSLSPGSSLDPRIVSEFQPLSTAHHAEKVRVENAHIGSNTGDGNSDDAPDWFPCDQRVFDVTGSSRSYLVTSIRCCARVCRGFLHPLLRAPPAA